MMTLLVLCHYSINQDTILYVITVCQVRFIQIHIIVKIKIILILILILEIRKRLESCFIIIFSPEADFFYVCIGTNKISSRKVVFLTKLKGSCI
jgi:hypothetical protein